MKDYLLRSFLFVPAHNKKFIENAINCKADALILDLEDAVPQDKKQIARDTLDEYFAKGVFKDKCVFIRINEIDSIEFVKDMRQCAYEDLDGYMLSKIQNRRDMEFVDRYLNLIELEHNFVVGKYVLAPLIETTNAVINISEIARSSERLIALCLGGEDYLNDLQSTYTHLFSALQGPRTMLAMTARAEGLLPIDTPYLELYDEEGFMKEESESYQNGFAGCLLINPRQIEPAHKCFSPQKEEIDKSKAIIEASECAKAEKGSGIAVHNGVMIGPPMVKRAQTVLRQVELIAMKNGGGLDGA